MSIDELAQEHAPTEPERRRRWVPITIVATAAVATAVVGLWSVANNASTASARASHDAVVESVDAMDVLWPQLELPVDQRSQAVMESGARLGGVGRPVDVSTQLRVNEPNRIGVVVTVTSNDRTTLLVRMVGIDAGGNASAIGSGCEVGVDYDGQSCEQIVEETLRTFTAPGG